MICTGCSLYEEEPFACCVWVEEHWATCQVASARQARPWFDLLDVGTWAGACLVGEEGRSTAGRMRRGRRNLPDCNAERYTQTS
jgi:hypothetical protein